MYVSVNNNITGYITINIIFFVTCRYLHMKRADCNNKNSEQTEAHIYDEVGMYAKTSTVCKSPDNVIFEVSLLQTPAYQPMPKPLDNNCNKTRNEKYNDYYIEGGDNSTLEDIYKEEKYLTNDCEKELQNDHAYNKLVHLKQ